MNKQKKGFKMKTYNQEKLNFSSLPYASCGIMQETILHDDDGISYDVLDIDHRVICPATGGIWLDDTQVAGTCDKPYRFIESALLGCKN